MRFNSAFKGLRDRIFFQDLLEDGKDSAYAAALNIRKSGAI